METFDEDTELAITSVKIGVEITIQEVNYCGVDVRACIISGKGSPRGVRGFLLCKEEVARSPKDEGDIWVDVKDGIASYDLLPEVNFDKSPAEVKKALGGRVNRLSAIMESYA